MVKKNSIEIQKQIDEEMNDRLKYLIELPDSVKYTRPSTEYHINGSLFNNQPLIGIEEPEHFYIPKEEDAKLQDLFTNYHIPEHIHQDLRYCWLNMVFAKKTALWSDEFHKHLAKDVDSSLKAYEMLKEIAGHKRIITSFTLTTKKREGDKFNRPEYDEFSGHVAAKMLTSIIEQYQHSDLYSTFKGAYIRDKKYGQPDMTHGHKNHLTESIDYYSWALFDYLRKTLFKRPPMDKIGTREWPELVRRYKRATRRHSKNKRYIFIGWLMVLAGLINKTEDTDDLLLRDRIKKKVNPRLQWEKKRDQEIG